MVKSSDERVVDFRQRQVAVIVLIHVSGHQAGDLREVETSRCPVLQTATASDHRNTGLKANSQKNLNAQDSS